MALKQTYNTDIQYKVCETVCDALGLLRGLQPSFSVTLLLHGVRCVIGCCHHLHHCVCVYKRVICGLWSMDQKGREIWSIWRVPAVVAHRCVTGQRSKVQTTNIFLYCDLHCHSLEKSRTDYHLRTQSQFRQFQSIAHLLGCVRFSIECGAFVS